MLLKYPAASTCGSGALGIGILGIFGPILVKTGVFGDLRDDCEDVEAFSREFPEVVEPDLGFCLREKSPMMEREGEWLA
tara:strand:+ start:326 stop:562 length:237 start_codon:yes stop_codon:yes gene_type:complete